MNIVAPRVADNRPAIHWTKEVSSRYVQEIWTLAYYALKDAGKTALLEDMKRQISDSKGPAQTLKIISSFVRITSGPK